MSADERAAAAPAARSGAAVGCALGGAALVALCVVPAGIVVPMLDALGVLDGGGMGPPIAPIADPSHAGLGIGGPHMPVSMAHVEAFAVPDTKVLELRVVSIEGASFTEAGRYCRVRVLYEPAASAMACSADVTCGEMPVYGDGEAVGRYECAAPLPADGLRAGADRSSMAEDGSPLFVVEDEVVRVSDPGAGGRSRGFELVLSRTAPLEAPFIDPATLVDPAAVQLMPPTPLPPPG